MTKTGKIALHQNMYSIDYISNKDVVIGIGTYRGKVFIIYGYKYTGRNLQKVTPYFIRMVQKLF